MNITYEIPGGTPDRSFDRRPAQRGHQADGSSIQNHSCGSHYPYVVGARDNGARLRWFVQHPDGSEVYFQSAEAAVYGAEWFAADLRREAEARAVRSISPERRTPWNDNELLRDSLGRSGTLCRSPRGHVRGMLELADDGGYDGDAGINALRQHLHELERLLTR